MNETLSARFQAHAGVVAGSRILSDGRPFDVEDPSTNSIVTSLTAAGPELVASAVTDALQAFKQAWGATPLAQRGRTLHNIARLLRERRSELATIEAVDAGIPLSMGLMDVEVAARYFEFYAGIADKVGGASIPLSGGLVDYTLREPWGVCGVIVPFNFPLQQISRSVAAALATGNTVVLKSSERSPLTATAIAELAVEAGLPPGAFNVVHGFAETGEALVMHEDVAHLTFTGSRGVGGRVMELCSRRVAPVCMELGGKSAQIVLSRAKLAVAAKTIAGTMFRSAGQACSAGSRVLVLPELHDELRELLVDEAQNLRVGEATAAGTEVGPLISGEQRDRVLEYVARAEEDGAQVVTGGDPGSRLPRGNFVLPTVIDNVAPGAELSQTELFGPVLGISTITDMDEAIRIANSSQFGLVAGIWTDDVAEALAAASQLEVGQVFVNNYGTGGGVEMPFGGRKGSGFGREKGLAAVDSYTQVKNVCIAVA
ncbi:aldehyde dehydrogenase family protein [Nocardia rhizosphaerihabitans]|uniref:Aldehyde dehydrogenase n=1 Tax=Nocardia rhizosphaerihabitans TaxID=1691570 RepID=A0ABQ2KC85_9NOCA|nr:aldehyde dehydrogenase family protein [Nocardia rhizosphaerihabitans]GGN78673.1 aldehyde dehydrogenase [Nocardia rhizosphaerihabitans]